jgi:uncharacterized membrane protein
MILWHSMDSWTVPADRNGLAFAVVAFLGGWAAPLFLFLAGLSVALAGARSPLEREAAGWLLQKRGWQVFGLAHLFRLQSFLLNPAASWSSLLKPDILNILGLGMVLSAICWTRATTTIRRLIWLLGPATIIVLLTPASRVWNWPTLLRPYAPRLEAYVRPVAGMGVFSVFPWVAFMLAGTFLGCVIAGSADSPDTPRAQRKLAVAAGLVALAGAIGMFLPPLTASEFWSTSLSFFVLRSAGMMLLLVLGWAWLRLMGVTGEAVDATARSPFVTMGRASLFVYWVHVELAYGFFSHPLHGALPLPWALVAFGLLTLFMARLASIWLRRPRQWIPGLLSPPMSPGAALS